MHIVVIGGGVVGLSQAWAFARRGASVSVLEARTSGLGASAVNAGWVVPAMASPVPAPGVVTEALAAMLRRTGPVAVRPSLEPGFLAFLLGMWRASTRERFRAGFAAQLALAERTDALIEDWLADGVRTELHRDGVLLAFTSAAKLSHQLDDADLPAALGRPLRGLTGDEARELEPTLSEHVVGSVVIPSEWHVDPVALVAGLAHRVRELGVAVHERTIATGIERDTRTGGRVVVTAGGERHPADAVVLAAGTWTGRLARGLGVRLPTYAGSGLCVDLAPGTLPRPRRMLYLAEERVAVTPLDGRLRLAGTMRFGAPRSRPTGGRDPVERVDRVRARAVARSPHRHLDGWPDDDALDRATLSVEAGARPMTPDGLPVIGPLPGVDGVWVSSGHGMMGVTLAPGSAEALTTAVLDGRTPEVLAPFDPARFARRARRTDRRAPVPDVTGVR